MSAEASPICLIFHVINEILLDFDLGALFHINNILHGPIVSSKKLTPPVSIIIS